MGQGRLSWLACVSHSFFLSPWKVTQGSSEGGKETALWAMQNANLYRLRILFPTQNSIWKIYILTIFSLIVLSLLRFKGIKLLWSRSAGVPVLIFMRMSAKKYPPLILCNYWILKCKKLATDFFLIKHSLTRCGVYSFNILYMHIFINAFVKGKEPKKIIHSVHRCKISNIQLLSLQLMHVSVSEEKQEQVQITKQLINQQRNIENEITAKIN